MIYLIVDENFANTQSLEKAVEIITSNLDDYRSNIWDELQKSNNKAVRHFEFSKHYAENAFENYWSSQGSQFKLVEVSLKSSFTYMQPKLKEVEVQYEVGSF